MRLALALGMTLAALAPAQAQQLLVTLDPAQTKIDWTLGDVLHTVHGTFRLKSGQIAYDPKTGNAAGEFVVDATSGDSGNHARDSKMHKDVLQSKLYPEISFMPKKVIGSISGDGSSTLQVRGIFHIHGADHDITLSVPVQATGTQVSAKTQFTVPYQDWGMKNPSTLFLRVDKTVQISIATTGKITNTNKLAELQ